MMTQEIGTREGELTRKACAWYKGCHYWVSWCIVCYRGGIVYCVGLGGIINSQLTIDVDVRLTRLKAGGSFGVGPVTLT